MINDIIDFIYPRRCAICGEIVIPKGNYVHERCREKLSYIKDPCCVKCGKSVESEEVEYCFDCSKKNYHYKKGYSVFLYEAFIKQSIVAFKYQGKKEYADFYVDEIIKQYKLKIKAIRPDVIIPVPIHHAKRLERGFNQAEIIAQGIGKALKLPVDTELLIRNKNTLPQKELNDKERLKNLQQAFRINPKKKSKVPLNTVLLVDDIYTTGSTIEACTNILNDYGIKTVYFISICIGQGY